MGDVTIPSNWITYGGAALSAACFLAVIVRNWSGIAGLFSKVRLPSGGILPDAQPEDRRICMMQNLDCLKADLVAVGTDAAKIEAIENIVWPEIRKAKVDE